MFHALLYLLISAQPTDPAWIGTLTVAKEVVVLERQGQRFQAEQGAGLLPGDRLHTSSQGGASLYLYGEQVVYLGSETRAELRRNAASGEPALVLLEGEARATVGSKQPMLVSTSCLSARIQKAIVRLSGDRYGASFGAEHGDVLVATTAGREQVLKQGFDVTATTQKGVFMPVKATGHEWTIQPAEYRRLAEESAAAGKPNCCPPKRPQEEPTERQPEDEQQPEPPQDQQDQQQQQQDQPQQQNAQNQFATTGGSALGLGSLSASSFAGNTSGGYNADANQQTFQGRIMLPDGTLTMTPFPGAIHIISGETRYSFNDVMLLPSEQMDIFIGGNPAYFSIGVGPRPTTQVTTDFNTGSNPVPYTIPIPQTNAYLIRLDQYGAIDPAVDPAAAEANNVGVAGLLGANPSAPSINGAVPLLDNRSPNQINPRATFAMGEFRLSPDGNSIDLAIRSSDQDRIIIKDANGNDAQDMVKPNQDVMFRTEVDARFLPQAPTVQVPQRNQTPPFRGAETTFSNLNFTRRAAATTLMADQLFDYSRRTGQTRFVITELDGRQRILDISGYQRQP